MYKVRATKYGSQLYPGQAVFCNQRWGEGVYLELYFWLLQSDTHTVLVDTGMDRNVARSVNPHVVERLGDASGEFIIDIDPPDAHRGLGVHP